MGALCTFLFRGDALCALHVTVVCEAQLISAALVFAGRRTLCALVPHRARFGDVIEAASAASAFVLCSGYLATCQLQGGGSGLGGAAVFLWGRLQLGGVAFQA